MTSLGETLARLELAVDELEQLTEDAGVGRAALLVTIRGVRDEIARAWKIVASQSLEKAVDLTGVPYTPPASVQEATRTAARLDAARAEACAHGETRKCDLCGVARDNHGCWYPFQRGGGR